MFLCSSVFLCFLLCCSSLIEAADFSKVKSKREAAKLSLSKLSETKEYIESKRATVPAELDDLLDTMMISNQSDLHSLSSSASSSVSSSPAPPPFSTMPAFTASPKPGNIFYRPRQFQEKQQTPFKYSPLARQALRVSDAAGRPIHKASSDTHLSAKQAEVEAVQEYFDVLDSIEEELVRRHSD